MTESVGRIRHASLMPCNVSSSQPRLCGRGYYSHVQGLRVLRAMVLIMTKWATETKPVQNSDPQP